MTAELTYEFNDGRCFDPHCQYPIEPIAAAVWLVDDSGTAYPFHERCADQPWPMSPVDPPTQTAQ